MERAYLRDYFIASLDAFPVEVWLSETAAQLVDDIGQTLLVNVRGPSSRTPEEARPQ